MGKKIPDLDLKIQLTSEYLWSGGVEKIYDANLLQDLIDVKFDASGKAIPETITSRVNAFMNVILLSHTKPPILSNENILEYISLIQKNTYFNQKTIETKEQIDELFETYKNQTDILFRGQRESSWRLYSTMQRYWIYEKMKDTEESYSAFLKKMVSDGGKYYEEQIKSILDEIHIDSVNDISVLGYLQHHNCPTPLLDWTYNFEIAMFFGIDGIEPNNGKREIGNYFSIYHIDEEHFDQGGMRTLLSRSLDELSKILKSSLITQIASGDKEIKEMEDHFKERSVFDKKRIKGSGLVNFITKMEHMTNIPISYFSDKEIDLDIAFSITNSENIKKQQGVFTWNSHHSKPLEVISNEQYYEAKVDTDPDDYRFCECYNINKNLAEYINEKLLSLGITKETIYPDKEINAKHIYEGCKKEN